MKTRIFPLMLSCLIGGNLEKSLMVGRSGTPTIINGTLLLGGRAQCLTLASWSGATVSPSDSLCSYRAGTKFPDNCGMPRINDLLSRHRIRTRSRFDSNFQNDFSIARNGHIPLNSCGIIVATRDAAQPVMFLSAVTARGPLWSGDQSLYLFDGALDRPAPHFCTAPPLSEFHLHDSSSVRNATRPSIQSSLVSGAGALLVAAGFPIKYNPSVHLKELL